MNSVPWLSLLTFTPLIGAVIIALLPEQRSGLPRKIGLLFTGLTLLLTLLASARFDAANPELQLVERRLWIPTLGVDYFVGIDGLGLLMVWLTVLVVPFALLAAGDHLSRAKWFTALLLMLQTGLLGTFTALNFFHWFIFWELSLVPAYFLVKLWGGPQRVAAATQLFLFTFAGSVLMLLAFLGVYQAAGSFDFIQLAELGRSGKLSAMITDKIAWPGLPASMVPALLFWGVFIGLAVKVPLIPLHTWLPPAYAEAPGSVTMVLTGVMSKMGVYGFLRILLPIFPEQMRAALTPLLWLAVATIVFSAYAAMAQTDLKRLAAYSSVNHLGYCLLGIFAALKWTGGQGSLEPAAALNGVVLQMFNHGITAAALFCLIGFLEARAGTRGLNDFGGLRRPAPVFCGIMGITLFASLGLPGLNGFISEFLIFKGVFPLATWAAAISVAGLLATAVFLLTAMQRVFHGPLPERWTGFADLTMGERMIVAPAIGLMFMLGIYPQVVLGFINPTVMQWVRQLG